MFRIITIPNYPLCFFEYLACTVRSLKPHSLTLAYQIMGETNHFSCQECSRECTVKFSLFSTQTYTRWQWPIKQREGLIIVCANGVHVDGKNFVGCTRTLWYCFFTIVFSLVVVLDLFNNSLQGYKVSFSDGEYQKFEKQSEQNEVSESECAGVMWFHWSWEELEDMPWRGQCKRGKKLWLTMYLCSAAVNVPSWSRKSRRSFQSASWEGAFLYNVRSWNLRRSFFGD